MAYYPEPVARLIEALQRLPGIGPKTAQRLTFFLLKRPAPEVAALGEALTQLKQRIVHCSVCFNVTEQDPCRICADPQRDQRTLCVVEEPNDLLALERTGEFRGRYHVLLGALSPLDGIGPEDLRVRELLARLDNDARRGSDPGHQPERGGRGHRDLPGPAAEAARHADHPHRPRAAGGRRPRVRRRGDALQGHGRPARDGVAVLGGRPAVW